MVGGGAFLFGEEIKHVAGPVSLLLLVTAVCLVGIGVIFFRRHEAELERCAETAIPGPFERYGRPSNIL